jgi:hypothetical protein
MTFRKDVDRIDICALQNSDELVRLEIHGYIVNQGRRVEVEMDLAKAQFARIRWWGRGFRHGLVLLRNGYTFWNDCHRRTCAGPPHKLPPRH